MAKVRVYELARELDVDSKTLLLRMKNAGIEAASHQSTLSDKEVGQIRAMVKGGNAATPAADDKKPRVVIRRRRRDSEPEDGADASAADAGEEASETSPSEPTLPSVAVSETPPTEMPTAAVVDDQETVAEAANEVVEVAEIAASAAEELPARHAPVSMEGSGLQERRPAKEVAREVREPVKPPPSKGGATIVRRATPEETQNIEQARDARHRRTVRKEDSRGTRVTSLGLASERAPGAAPTPPPLPFDEDDPEAAARRREREKTKAKVPGTAAQDEEAAIERRKVTAKARRANAISTRVLLESVTSEDDEDAPVVPAAPANFQGRTVYTPSASNRKRDLKRRRDLKKTQITMPKAEKRIVKMSETISVGELAKQLAVKAGELIKKLMAQGVMATINQPVDFDTATLIASEYGYEVKSTVRNVEDILDYKPSEQGDLEERPPIVTVMGHVDHGKTSILDAIRQANVVAGEAGGITQHIGAYSVVQDGRRITFIDTPGHEAFSSMRARGTKVTDIVVLVVAADDGVMPQTVEAISHAKDAGVPIIVAVNKIDKPNTNIDRIYSELAEHGVQAEEWGGEVQFVKCSALEKIGLDTLLESILLQSEVLELRSSRKGACSGSVVEAHLDKGRGPVATLLVQRGTLRRGDVVVAGTSSGRVRAMYDHLGHEIDEATPSMPVGVLGLDAVPLAGDRVDSVEDEKKAKEVAAFRAEQQRVARGSKSSASSLEDLLGKIKSEDRPEVAIILKADTQGSVEAVAEAVMKIDSEKVRNRVVHRGVGGVSESDISLAAASGALIIAFNVRAARGLDEVAEREGVVIKYFSIIYDVVDVVKSVMAGRLPPTTHEVFLGRAEVRQAISVPKIGTIAGSSVLDGKILRNSHCRLIRDDIVIYEGKLGSLRRFKDDVKEVQTGYECGIGLENYNDIKTGDVIEVYQLEEQAATL